MALSKKHYEEIAAILSAARADDDPYADDYTKAVDKGRDNAHRGIASELATYFANDNPRFDRDRFLKAAGVK